MSRVVGSCARYPSNFFFAKTSAIARQSPGQRRSRADAAPPDWNRCVGCSSTSSGPSSEMRHQPTVGELNRHHHHYHPHHHSPPECNHQLMSARHRKTNSAKISSGKSPPENEVANLDAFDEIDEILAARSVPFSISPNIRSVLAPSVSPAARPNSPLVQASNHSPYTTNTTNSPFSSPPPPPPPPTQTIKKAFQKEQGGRGVESSRWAS